MSVECSLLFGESYFFLRFQFSVIPKNSPRGAGAGGGGNGGGFIGNNGGRGGGRGAYGRMCEELEKKLKLKFCAQT